MRPFSYERADDTQNLSRLQTGPTTQFLAGGTTLVDLMKLGTMTPAALVDINGLDSRYGAISLTDGTLHLGALAHMSTAAAHPDIRRDFPVIAQSLDLAASPQIRNMATLGGNVLQRTRCNYFRDPSWTACNKRNPGSGCGAISGVNRKHAVLGVSEHCIATYPGDFAQALVALDAKVEISGPAGDRVIRFEDLHLAPGDTPHRETVLRQGDLITGFTIPTGPWTRRSLYLKIRDRESYEFALASAAVALQIEDNVVREARIALGGVATKPWRSREAEESLIGKSVTPATAEAAGWAAFAINTTHGENTYKPTLGRRTLERALLHAAQLEV